MISIIHPSRSRPVKSFNTLRDWISKAHTDVEVLIALDDDDPHLKTYISMHGALGDVVFGHHKSAIEAINHAAKMATGDIIIVVSDDTECFYGWGKHIENFTHGKCDWILKTQDGIQDWLITMPLMDRAYYERFGYIYHPDYSHMYADTELTCVSELVDSKIVTNFHFPHKHYSVTKEQADSVSHKADQSFEPGRITFKRRLANNFDLPHDQITGVLTNNFYTNGSL